jgi:hypothetical protein
MEVIRVADKVATHGAVDIYLPTVSGRSLPQALEAGHWFGDDVRDFSPLREARERVVGLLERSKDEGCLIYVGSEAFVVRVRARQSDLEALFGCRITVFPPLRFPPDGAAQPVERDAARHGPDRFTMPRARFESPPRLRAVGEWIEAVEPINRWPIHVERDEIVCQMFGHDWDIIAFDRGCGLLECTCCGEELGTPPLARGHLENMRRARREGRP